MTNKEKQLFKNLCSFQTDELSEEQLASASPEVLGHLFFNRMQGIAYGNMKRQKLLGKVNREFRNSLQGAYLQNIEKNRSFFTCVQMLGEILSGHSDKYAMLKGALLCRLYPEGYRTSNDIDLLVRPADVTIIGNTLLEAGFLQGNIRNGVFIPATREEIITSKMMRGETVPYIKEVNLPQMKFLEVDINFSLDYKNSNTDALNIILSDAAKQKIGAYSVNTLSPYDFFIHLCAHLYKEATTLPWVEMMRDMTLYKYSDIYLLVSLMTSEDVNEIFARAKSFFMDKIVAFAIVQMSYLFECKNKYAVKVAKSVLYEAPNFIHHVISPKERKIYVYSQRDVFERLFVKNRKILLTEENEE